MKMIPVMTEKSMKLIKDQGYTFWVPINLDKIEIKNLIGKTFGVEVINVRTINVKGGIKKNVRGKKQKIKAGKKAIVFIKEGQKIRLFEEEKKVKKTKKGTKKK